MAIKFLLKQLRHLALRHTSNTMEVEFFTSLPIDMLTNNIANKQSFQIIPLHFTIQGRPANTKQSSSFSNISIGFLQC